MMKITVLFVCALFLAIQPNLSKAESGSENRSSFPIIVTLQFHSMSLPFRDTGSNFSNIGISIGTEYGIAGSKKWFQEISLGYYRNKAVGNGIMLYTQTAFNPEVLADSYAGLKAGVGYLYSFRPGESFHQVDGEWRSVGRQGKGMLMLPVGMSIGYNPAFKKGGVSPFMSYQFILVSGYNRSIPIVPYTLIQAGSKIDF